MPVLGSSLPPAATITEPWLSANCTAARSADVLLVVIDTLMTCACSLAASSMPWASRLELPVSWLFTLTERILASGATPTNGKPFASRSLAAMMPDISVPWPTQSPKPVPVTSTALTRPASCLLKSTPLSTTATVTPWPSVCGHTLLQSSTVWAQGIDVTFLLAWPGPGHYWVGWGSVATGVGTDGLGGLAGLVGVVDFEGLGDGLAAAGARGDRAAADPAT